MGGLRTAGPTNPLESGRGGRHRGLGLEFEIVVRPAGLEPATFGSATYTSRVHGVSRRPRRLFRTRGVVHGVCGEQAAHSVSPALSHGFPTPRPNALSHAATTTPSGPTGRWSS